MNPLKSNSILTNEEIKSLFSNIDVILTVNHEISTNFQNELEKIPEIQLFNIGQVFRKTVCFVTIKSFGPFWLPLMHVTRLSS